MLGPIPFSPGQITDLRYRFVQSDGTYGDEQSGNISQVGSFNLFMVADTIPAGAVSLLLYDVTDPTNATNFQLAASLSGAVVLEGNVVPAPTTGDLNVRVTLNIDRCRVQASPLDVSTPPDPLAISLGDAPLNVQIVSNVQQLLPLLDANSNLVEAARVEFNVLAEQSGSPGLPDIDRGPIVTGAADIPLAFIPQIVNLGEDWSASALQALFGTNQTSLTVYGQYRWRNGASPDAPWVYSAFFPIKVLNAAFPDVSVPDGQPTVGPSFYLPNIIAYTGDPNSLESINGAALPNNTLIQVVINGSGSAWRVIKPATQSTDTTDHSYVALLDGTAHLARVLGY